MVVGLAVAAVVILGTGTAVYLSQRQSTPTATPKISQTPQKDHQSSQPIDQAAIAALAPQKVKVVSDNGPSVTLKWTLPAEARRYPVVLQREPHEETAPRITALKAGATSTRVLGLDRELGYCFIVGVALRITESSTIAWSKPTCIRGAVATTG